MESAFGGRDKKLIRALETAELHGRPTCSECTDKLRGERGCRKPGFDIPGRMVWRWTSPALQGDADMLHECPVGYILREAPHTYDILDAASYCDSLSPAEHAIIPRYMQHVLRCVRSEKSRLFDMKQKKQQGNSDAAYGARVRAGR